ncbi:hypothetical protein RvY_15106 [Ramazzottius varieornatus]|uniref:Ubiquitin-like domain-containing protein n=1 Tax=Ramazzottius varieornatus TaxID=947166 RepID=A0A1D1VX94_RAMVA|nr:hypothetical protein RvY_15106 [Ramazzottius varieornatus]
MDINPTVDILVKTPLLTDRVVDETVRASLNWNVRQLKEHLARVIPRNPSPDSQKLILCGKILPDSAVLKECFSSVPSGSLPVLHLVWRPATTVPSTTLTAIPAVRNDGLRQRNQRIQNAGENSFTTFAAPASLSAAYTPDEVQMAQYFQMYNAYIQQYYYSQMSMFPPGIPYQHLPSPHVPQALAVPQPNHRPAEPERIPQVVMNAAQGGNVINEDEVGRRDAFDWFYTCFRLVALIVAIYVSSSTSRFFWAFTMVSIILLFNTVRDFVQWRARHQRQQREAERANQVNAVEGQEGEGNAQAEVVAPPVNPGLFSTAVNIVVGFITSLVPENVAQIIN